MQFLLFFLSAAFIISSCSNQPKVLSATAEVDKLDEYWFQGEAEITSYELKQNRYKDEHPGTAVLVFVTEDFLTDKQVKNDNYTNPASTGILKVNKISKFTTGIYDYSIMTSVFTPYQRNNFPHTLKVTNSSQEWCGQTYQQVNLEKDNYRSMLHSYFENEADRTSTEGVALLEDELWTLLRINPDEIPTGSIEIIPSLEIQRLMHIPFQAVNGEIRIQDTDNDEMVGAEKVLNVSFPSLERTLKIYFTSSSPYKISGWTDSYPSAFDKVRRTTKAVRKAEVMEPYWKLNALEDSSLRRSLKLDERI